MGRPVATSSPARALAKVQQWRRNAIRVRAAAENLRDAVARDLLLEWADRYDRIADDVECFELS